MESILLLDQLTFTDAAPGTKDLSFTPFFRFKTTAKSRCPESFCELVHAQGGTQAKDETFSKSVHGDFYISVRHFENVF